MTPSPIRRFAAASVLVLVLAACGGPSEDDGAEEEAVLPVETAAPAATPDRTEMHEDFLAIVPGDKTEALGNIEPLYLAVLSRQPTADETKAAEEYLASHADRREKAVSNLIWGLLASNEFCANH